MVEQAPALIALDWGSSSFRAHLMSREGDVLDEIESADGVSTVAPHAFPAALERLAGGWFLAFPAGYGPVGLWSGLAVGLAAVALMLTVRLHFCARNAALHKRLGAVPAGE